MMQNITDKEVTIVTGWFGREKMKSVLFSNNTLFYKVLLYSCESRWQTASSHYWRHHDATSRNIDVKALVATGEHREIVSELIEPEREIVDSPDQLDEIELVLRDRKFKKYSYRTNDEQEESIEAYPVTFVGGQFGFFTEQHELISVTNIIYNRRNEVQLKTPDELTVGDFIAFRESSSDMIREIADQILEKSSKSELRKIAGEWRQALKVESLFSNIDTVVEKLAKHGCIRNKQTIHNWIFNDSTILPSQKEDLLHIAEATEDPVLLDRIEIVYEAGKEIRRTHVMAGNILSKLLQKQIGKYIAKAGVLNPYNIGESLVLELEEIGRVHILKIIDISSPLLISSNETNRLHDEF